MDVVSLEDAVALRMRPSPERLFIKIRKVEGGVKFGDLGAVGSYDAGRVDRSDQDQIRSDQIDQNLIEAGAALFWD